METVTNIVIAGLGGQGVIKASDILAQAALAAGLDVKKSEIHGMSQRGGSVNSDVRFGARVLSPMVPTGEADFLVVVAPDQVENNRPLLCPTGVLIEPRLLGETSLANPRTLNVALLGVLSVWLPFPPEAWRAAFDAQLAPKIRVANEAAFAVGIAAGAREKLRLQSVTP
ncbi:2-oxoacid:acceptor oxidoreductase family protein [Opitutus sp. ER46]|uniref:2-oxoacid:acceptor oxidoreductase family protein n=1 Tax=Opitutus sp. ER46 TaxID=2161864 RepID=UPI000D30DC93|nr:2-oxoacid:acceptor oxidoreductase family protein [Opitutus sp. ER46]PTY00154.1 pyruvate ferredoxin oxidoreductase [Opitutus sp. ER46]